MVTLPIHDVLDADYPALRSIAQISEDGYFSSLRSRLMASDKEKLVLTFEDLLRRSLFAQRMQVFLKILEENYNYPVDLEFTVDINAPQTQEPALVFTFLQCRPQSQLAKGKENEIPGHLPEKDIMLQSRFMVPQGVVDDIAYALFVPPNTYFDLQMNERFELARTIGKVNKAMKDKISIFVGPGRWGSTNADLGVPVSYSDIYNTRALVELSGEGVGSSPEPSLGTHFFQDLLEAQIFPLAVMLDDPLSVLQPSFFYYAPNSLDEFIPADETLKNHLRLIKVSDFRKNNVIRLVMNEERNTAVGYLIQQR